MSKGEGCWGVARLMLVSRMVSESGWEKLLRKRMRPALMAVSPAFIMLARSAFGGMKEGKRGRDEERELAPRRIQ